MGGQKDPPPPPPSSLVCKNIAVEKGLMTFRVCVKFYKYFTITNFQIPIFHKKFLTSIPFPDLSINKLVRSHPVDHNEEQVPSFKTPYEKL